MAATRLRQVLVRRRPAPAALSAAATATPFESASSVSSLAPPVALRARLRLLVPPEEEEEENPEERVNVVGFKPTQAHRDYLKKQGLKVVSNPNDDYSILLVKEPIKLCNKLLLALLQGKRIESDLWIFNKNS